MSAIIVEFLRHLFQITMNMECVVGHQLIQLYYIVGAVRVTNSYKRLSAIIIE